MAVRLTVGGACEKIILPCPKDSFYADATSCTHYYRCQGFRIWRNACPPGTASMHQASAPCTGRSWHCDANNPSKRCSKVRSGKNDGENDKCEFKINLPCKNETRFLDPETCGHYFTCKPEDKGQVLGRKQCDLPARCHEMKNNRFCSMTDSKQKCLMTGVVTEGVNDDNGGSVNMDEKSEINNTSLIIGLAVGAFILLLIIGFLALIFYKRKRQRKQRPPHLPALTIGAPISINPPSQSVRYSQVERPLSVMTYLEPNNYSTISATGDSSPESDNFYKAESLKSPSNTSGHYEELGCVGLDSPVYSSACDIYDREQSKDMSSAGSISSRDAMPVPPIPARTLSLHAKPLSEYAKPNSNVYRPGSLYTRPAPRPSKETRAIQPLPTETRLIPQPTRLVPRLPAERPPAELPRNSRHSSSGSSAHPYFVLDGPSVAERNSLELTNQISPRKYFVLEKDITERDGDTVSIATTYCEIDDDYFLRDEDGFKCSPNTSSV